MALFGLIPDGPEAQGKAIADAAEKARAAAQQTAQDALTPSPMKKLLGALGGNASMPPPPDKKK